MGRGKIKVQTSMKIKISPFAEKDLMQSINYYNDQKENLGLQFYEVINDTFRRIKDNPKQFPKSWKEMRKATTTQFPFIVFFVLKDDTAYVLGIFHTSRNPKIMKNRYENE